eukprot:CAMPEP_0180508400 /NCGR_PEP_ID=MMETSP1036_2-20121128/49149_1 /TAXON_ID=632150 /ORGANISM="Azadinium spinosum, Strain 3D9" /LENGTH=122 /DNA_ID=CAMNT_0022518699 /DNA_START=205 /DNA_END=573 /DNA_ORIENTATION=-
MAPMLSICGLLGVECLLPDGAPEDPDLLLRASRVAFLPDRVHIVDAATEINMASPRLLLELHSRGSQNRLVLVGHLGPTVTLQPLGLAWQPGLPGIINAPPLGVEKRVEGVVDGHESLSGLV